MWKVSSRALSQYNEINEEEGTYVSQYGRRSKPKKPTDYDEV